MRAFAHWLFFLAASSGPLPGEEGDTAFFEKAEELFTATLYQEAIPFYLQVKDPLVVPLARLRLGQSKYFDEKYDEALPFLEEALKGPLPEKEEEEAAFLVALSHRHLGNFRATAEILSRMHFTKYRQQVLFELGLAYFLLGEHEASLQSLSCLKDEPPTSHLHLLSRFYLARIHMAQHRESEAQTLLNGLKVDNDHPLYKELLFLKGLAAFQQKDYAGAQQLFNTVASTKKLPKEEWEKEGLYHLGWCCIKLAENSSEKKQKLAYLEQAIRVLEPLIDSESRERETVALAYVYVLWGEEFHDRDKFEQASTIIRSFRGSFGPEEEAKALLLQAESSNGYESRKIFYDGLTNPDNTSQLYYTRALYMGALNDFAEAQKSKSRELYARAAEGSEKAFLQAQPDEDRLAVLCRRLQIQALWEKGTSQDHLAAVNVLLAALADYPDSQELFDLCALYAVRLVGENIPDKTMQKIEAALRQSAFPAALFSLGAFYMKSGQDEKAMQAYTAFAEKNPDSPLLPQALLQASLAMEHLQGLSEYVRSCRRKIYATYATADIAPLAYFLSYSYQEYLQGDRTSIKHLDAFKERFPDSSLIVLVNYLLGLDLKRDRYSAEGKWIRKKNPAQSLQAFSEAENAFERLDSAGKIPEQEKDYFSNLRYRSILERGLINYQVAEEANAAKRDIYLQYAIAIFEQLKKNLEFSEDVVQKESLLFSLYEECAYWLALSYLHANCTEAAEKVMDDMLAVYQAKDVSSGYYLAKFYSEKANVHFFKENYEKALSLYTMSDEAAKGKFLGTEEKLALWIRQSECCKALEQPESAMLVLSKVINDDSISHLRLKAMFMRASLYEALGRPGLARRQLEFVAKMGGGWAEQAKIKLEKDYAAQ
jgi:tetratricopeptide (TPR) repeat protein